MNIDRTTLVHPQTNLLPLPSLPWHLPLNCMILLWTALKQTHLLHQSFTKMSLSDTVSYSKLCPCPATLCLCYYTIRLPYIAYNFLLKALFFLGTTFPANPAHFYQHLSDDVSHWGGTSEIMQSAIYVIRCFLAMDGSGQQQFLTPKIRVGKSESLICWRKITHGALILPCVLLGEWEWGEGRTGGDTTVVCG